MIGKIGVTSWEAKEIIIDSSGWMLKEQDGTDLIGGLGIEYKWPNGIAIRAESEFFKGIVDEDYELHTLGITYAF